MLSIAFVGQMWRIEESRAIRAPPPPLGSAAVK